VRFSYIFIDDSIKCISPHSFDKDWKNRYLLDLHKKIIIPEAVFSEVIGGGILAGLRGCKFPERFIPRIENRETNDKTRRCGIKSIFAPGEYEAIILAQELQVPLIIDEERVAGLLKRKEYPIIQQQGDIRIARKANN